MKKKIIAVIPAYNEENTIGLVLKGLKNLAEEIIVVDDASTDKTAEIARKDSAVVVKHNANMGYDKSIDDGFREAAKRKADIIFTFDADGQHVPDDIPTIVAPISDGTADIVVGIRPYKQRFSERIFSAYTRRKIGVNDPLCGVKAYSIKTYESVGYFDKINSIGTEFLFNCNKRGFRIKEVEIHMNKRQDDSRFGNTIKGNFKILRAFFKVYTKFR